MNIQANVTFPEPHEHLVGMIDEAVEAGTARGDGETVWFDVDGPLSVWDEDDDLSRPLLVLYALVDGTAATLYAPECADVNELERRIYRDLAPEFTIDDWQDAVVPTKG